MSWARVRVCIFFLDQMYPHQIHVAGACTLEVFKQFLHWTAMQRLSEWILQLDLRDHDLNSGPPSNFRLQGLFRVSEVCMRWMFKSLPPPPTVVLHAGCMRRTSGSFPLPPLGVLCALHGAAPSSSSWPPWSCHHDPLRYIHMCTCVRKYLYKYRYFGVRAAGK
jgi:hypothetical protein